MKALRVTAFTLIVMAIGLAGLAFYGVSRFSAPGPHLGERIVMIEAGESLGHIADKLEREGAIHSALIFNLMIRIMGEPGSLRAGEYAIPANASMAEIYQRIREGETLLHALTVPEGLTSAQVVSLLVADERLSGTVDTVPVEGSLLPETYLFSRGDSRERLLARMSREQDALLAAFLADPGLPAELSTLDEAVILASIVEKETGVPDERPLIAGVFLNRLRNGMRLQSDPTVIYGISGGAALGRSLTRSELNTPTPYNTYVIRGLPPTPIANPGREALRAVFFPAETEALYFVADGTGGHVFAATLEEHEENVARWRRIERERRSQ